MLNLGAYEFKTLNTGKITTKESSTNTYVEEVYKSEKLCTSTKQYHIILFSKY